VNQEVVFNIDAFERLCSALYWFPLIRLLMVSLPLPNIVRNSHAFDRTKEAKQIKEKKIGQNKQMRTETRNKTQEKQPKFTLNCAIRSLYLRNHKIKLSTFNGVNSISPDQSISHVIRPVAIKILTRMKRA
jgi:hypothetical protein